MAWLAELQGDLVEASRRRSRARRHRLTAVALVLPLLALVAVLASAHGTAEASTVRVRSAPGGVVVTVVDRAAPPRAVADDLSRAGLAVQLQVLRTGPSGAGRLLFLRAGASQGGADDLFVPDGQPVVVGAGELAPAGVPYDQPSDAFAAGEALHCLGWRGESAARLAATLAGHDDVTVRWRSDGGAPTVITPGDSRVVVTASGVEAGVVEVFVSAGRELAGDAACVP
jgi:hypothetical protein